MDIFERADAMRREQNLAGGYVLFFNGEPFGWKAALTRPETVRPDVLAVGADQTDCYVAVGGNDQDGAKAWVIVSRAEKHMRGVGPIQSKNDGFL